MDKVALSENEIVPLVSVAPGIHGLRIVFVNVFGVTHADGSWSLIDAGIPFSTSRIRHWAQETFGSAPNAIVLTHGHFDHVSAAGELAGEWDVPIYIHALELPYVTGKKEYPGPKPFVGGGAMALLSPLYPRGPVDLGHRVKSLSPDGTVPGMPGWTALPTPGHTDGHVSFFREVDRTLLVGDAFCTTKTESFFEAAGTQPPELHGPPAYFTSNWHEARESVRKLAALNPAVVAPGHGKPMAGAGVQTALRILAHRFEEIAVPETENSGRRAA